MNSNMFCVNNALYGYGYSAISSINIKEEEDKDKEEPVPHYLSYQKNLFPCDVDSLGNMLAVISS